MSTIMGGLPPLTGANNVITGTADPDTIIGDPYALSIFGVLGSIEPVTSALTRGVGGDDRVDALGGGDDVLDGGDGMDLLVGDASGLYGQARGGDETIDGGADTDIINGDADEMAGESSVGNDLNRIAA